MRAVLLVALGAVLGPSAMAHADRAPDPAAPAPAPAPAAPVPADPTPAPVEPAPATEPAASEPPVAPNPVLPPAEPAEPEPAAAVPLTPTATELAKPSRNKDIAWLLVGGALTFATTGAVLAYSTASAEQDIKDLYETTTSTPPTFDAETHRRYDDLVDEGERYELLSYISFGLAGACAASAGYFFWRASQESDVVVTPVVTPTSAGVSVRF